MGDAKNSWPLGTEGKNEFNKYYQGWIYLGRKEARLREMQPPGSDLGCLCDLRWTFGGGSRVPTARFVAAFQPVLFYTDFNMMLLTTC